MRASAWGMRQDRLDERASGSVWLRWNSAAASAALARTCCHAHTHILFKLARVFLLVNLEFDNPQRADALEGRRLGHGRHIHVCVHAHTYCSNLRAFCGLSNSRLNRRRILCVHVHTHVCGICELQIHVYICAHICASTRDKKTYNLVFFRSSLRMGVHLCSGSISCRIYEI